MLADKELSRLSCSLNGQDRYQMDVSKTRKRYAQVVEIYNQRAGTPHEAGDDIYAAPRQRPCGSLSSSQITVRHHKASPDERGKYSTVVISNPIIPGSWLWEGGLYLFCPKNKSSWRWLTQGMRSCRGRRPWSSPSSLPRLGGGSTRDVWQVWDVLWYFPRAVDGLST